MRTGTSVIASNLKAVQQGCQVFGEQMASHGGGSILTRRRASPRTTRLSRGSLALYSRLPKAAVVNLTQNVARGVGPQGGPGQCLEPRLLPGRAESQDPRSRADREDHGRYADGPIRRATRARRGDDPPALEGRRQFHHRGNVLCRWRLHGHATLRSRALADGGLSVIQSAVTVSLVEEGSEVVPSPTGNDLAEEALPEGPKAGFRCGRGLPALVRIGRSRPAADLAQRSRPGPGRRGDGSGLGQEASHPDARGHRDPRQGPRLHPRDHRLRRPVPFARDHRVDAGPERRGVEHLTAGPTSPTPLESSASMP